MKKVRVLLADDHRLVAEGLRSLLEPHFDVVGIVSDGQELVTAAITLEPDVVVLDISMPSVSGIEAAHRLQAENRRSKVIFLTMHKALGVRNTAELVRYAIRTAENSG